MTAECEVCDTALVHDDGKPPHDIDIARTSAALQERVDSGLMHYVRGDVPLEDMLPLAESDLKFSIVSYLMCGDCGRMRFWGLCIRGAPIFKVVEVTAPSTWRWGDVPPRERWART
ncbi:MAG: hypothetical protein ABWY03_03260 [Microbacterium sp.]